MLARSSRSTSLSRIPSSSRSYTMAYLPHQATHEITPIETRAKPPAHFYTGKPNFYTALDMLESAGRRFQERLILARCPINGPARKDMFTLWKSADDLQDLLMVPKIRPGEYDKLVIALRRLSILQRAADDATDTSTVDQITLLLTPFASKANFGDNRPPGHSIKHTLNEAGRSHTTGSRKTSKAHVWMQFTPALAATFYNPKETQRLADREIALEVHRVAEEVRIAAIRAAGSASLGPVFEYLDRREAKLLSAKKAAGLLPEPTSIPIKSPVEKLWDAEKDKKARFEKVARDLLELAEHDKREAEAKAIKEGSTTTKDGLDGDETNPTTSTTSPDDPDVPPDDPDVPLAEGEVFVPPTQQQLFEEKVASELAKFDAIKASRSTTPVASNSNSPDRSVPKDGTLNVVRTTDAPAPSDPMLGQILINNVPFHRYFTNPKDREHILRPLKVARLLGAFNIFITVHTGGPTGHAGAIGLGIARGICVHQPTARNVLLQAGCLTVDMRQVERKKTGQPKARKKNKWVKR